MTKLNQFAQQLSIAFLVSTACLSSTVQAAHKKFNVAPPTNCIRKDGQAETANMGKVSAAYESMVNTVGLQIQVAVPNFQYQIPLSTPPFSSGKKHAPTPPCSECGPVVPSAKPGGGLVPTFIN